LGLTRHERRRSNWSAGVFVSAHGWPWGCHWFSRPQMGPYTAIVRGRRRNSWCRAGRSLRPRLATSASCWLDWLRGPRSSNTRVTGERSGR